MNLFFYLGLKNNSNAKQHSTVNPGKISRNTEDHKPTADNESIISNKRSNTDMVGVLYFPKMACFNTNYGAPTSSFPTRIFGKIRGRIFCKYVPLSQLLSLLK